MSQIHVWFSAFDTFNEPQTVQLTGVVVHIVRSHGGVVRLLPADRKFISDTVGKRQRLRLPGKSKGARW